MVQVEFVLDLNCLPIPANKTVSYILCIKITVQLNYEDPCDNNKHIGVSPTL